MHCKTLGKQVFDACFKNILLKIRLRECHILAGEAPLLTAAPLANYSCLPTPPFIVIPYQIFMQRIN